MLKVIERLIGKGYDLRRYDKNVIMASLNGANKSYILNVIPHISQLMVATLEDALAHGETIVNETYREVSKYAFKNERQSGYRGPCKNWQSPQY